MYLQLRIFNPEYTTERICAAVGDMPISACVLYCKLGAKYSAHPPVYAMWTMVPDRYSAFTAPYIQTSIFIWTYLHCYCTYHDNSMRFILHSWCQIQRTSSSLCYVNCGPGHIQSTYSSEYSGFNIRLNLSALLLEIIGHVDARYTANLLPNTAHILRFTLCDLWSRSYTRYFQHRIFRLQYSAEGSSPAIVGISTIQWALYCKHSANYSALPLAFAMWTVVPHVYNVFTAPHIQSWIFDWTYLRCCWRYAYICMRVILQILCQIQRTSSGLRYVNYGPGHIQCTYNSIYSDFNIHLNVSALLLYISRQFNARYTANLLPNTAHILRFTLCELWSRTYTMHLQLHIFRLQYSFECICAAIVHITTIQCALYCILGAKYSALPLAFAMWTVVPHVYNVFTAPHIQSWIYDWTYLRCCWRYAYICMRVILQILCQIQSPTSGLRYVNCGPGQIQCIYSSAYSDFNVHLNVPALLLEISRQLNARYTANLLTNTAHILQFKLCELWSRPYTKYFPHRIFRL
jgi:hypothetical protein